MKIFLQNYKSGKMVLEDIPVPMVTKNYLLIKNIYSAVSVGTEKQMLKLANKSLIGKALERPDLVKLLFNKMQTDGVLTTIKEALKRLEEYIPLGYSSAGIVVEIGENVRNFKVGDFVSCGGYPYAIHAEYVLVPENFVVRVPQDVSLKEAAFASIAAIAIHGFRSAQLSIGSKVAIIGLGLIGLIGVQVALASGVEVLAVDIDEEKVKIAKELGAGYGAVIGQESITDIVNHFTEGKGVDSVIIYASAPKSNAPLDLAAQIARERGIISAVGFIKLDVPRKIFYEKELHLVVPRSGGAGIYDYNYEEKGIDYPIGYIRWTYKENMKTFINLLVKNRIKLDKLITHEFDFSDALTAYNNILEGKDKYIGVIFNYGQNITSTGLSRKIIFKNLAIHGKKKDKINIGIIGAGLFTKTVVLPILNKKRDKVNFVGISSSTGIKASQLAKEYGFKYVTSDYKDILNDKNIDAVIITTRHDSHAQISMEALMSDKHVFVEKPLAINSSELELLVNVYNESKKILMVGFNRRFSDYSLMMKENLEKISGPMVIVMRVNAGYIPIEHWTQDPDIGGGRIIGELCHFIDLAEYLSSSEPKSVYAQAVDGETGKYIKEDNLVITIGMTNGALVTITYTSVGNKAFPRERIEVFKGEAVGLIDNFRRFVLISPDRKISKKRKTLDRGHRNEFTVFINSIVNGKQPVHFKEYYLTTLTTFKIIESLKKKTVLEI